MAKTVLAFGSFDILHPGHLLYLERARRLGDRLIVIIARDDTIKRIKGKAPFFNQIDRARMISSLKIVYGTVIGKKLLKPHDKYEVIAKYKPSILVFGYDQKVNLPELKAWLRGKGLKTKIVRIKAKEDPRKYKSSKVKF
ncbi:MAG TPA: adenylyltransferase/cytidyltransferase family protein [Candidatus Aquilonibacter sp.]|nr:adenylyltransferase/cytidyltransferase family protein [Candidatus Aquilonibacter sp.]